MALARAQRDAEFQRTVELVNRFTVSTVQFLNRFAAMCEDKIHNANRQLQSIEVQVKLLEVKLDSTDDVDGESAPASTVAPSKPAPVPVVAAPKVLALNGPPPPPGLGAPRGGAQAPPPMAAFGSQPGGANYPPPPGSASMKQPPLPPGVVLPGGATTAPAIGGALALMPPPPPPGQPPAGYMPPPPPMPMGGNAANSTRNHPRLVGYFKMADAGVPAAAIKAKMQADGMNPAWFDAPDAPAPAGIPPLKSDTLYDSD